MDIHQPCDGQVSFLSLGESTQWHGEFFMDKETEGIVVKFNCRGNETKVTDFLFKTSATDGSGEGKGVTRPRPQFLN